MKSINPLYVVSSAILLSSLIIAGGLKSSANAKLCASLIQTGANAPAYQIAYYKYIESEGKRSDEFKYLKTVEEGLGVSCFSYPYK